MSRIRNITTALAAVLLTAPAFAYDIQTPGNDTKLSVYGYVYALGNYFIDQQQVGVGAISAQNMSVKPDGNYLFSVQPSRYGFASTYWVACGSVILALALGVTLPRATAAPAEEEAF